MKKILLFACILVGTYSFGQTVVDPQTFPLQNDPKQSNFEFYTRKGGQNKRATFDAVRLNMSPRYDTVAYIPSFAGNTQNRGSFVLASNGTKWYITGEGEGMPIGGQVFTAGTGIAISGGGAISNTGDLSNTNELQTLSISGLNITLSGGGGTISLPATTTYTAGTGIAITGTVISNSGDPSATNEGALTVSPGTSTSTVISSNTSGSVPITLQVTGGLTISESGSTITLDGGTGKYQTVKNNGSAVTQRNALNFVPGSDIAFNITDDSGNNETEVFGSLTNTGVTAGTYPITNNIPIITVDSKGRITSVTSVAPLDSSPTNEIQTLSIAGQVVTISGGNTITLPTSSVAARLTGNGTSGSPLDIAQQSATSGQVLKWNGTSWAPAADAGGVSIPNLELTYGSGSGIQSNSGLTYSTQGRINLNGILVGRPNGISAGVSLGTGVGYLNTEGTNVLIGDSCAPQLRASRYNIIIGPFAAKNLRGPGSAFALSRSNFAAIGGYEAFRDVKWSFDLTGWGYNVFAECDSCNFVTGVGYGAGGNADFGVYASHFAWGAAINADTLLSTTSLGAESMRYRNRAEEDTWLGAKAGEGLSTSRTYGNNGTGFLIAPVIRNGKRNDLSGWRTAPTLRDGEWNTFNGPYTGLGCTDCTGNTVLGGQITIAADAYRQILIGDSFGGVKFWNTGSNTILYDYLTLDYYKASTTPSGTAVKNLSVTSTGVVVLTDISSGGSTVAEPLNQVVIGTGTSTPVDSDPGFTYNPTTNLLSTNGDLVIGDGVNGKITLANNDQIIKIDANYTYFYGSDNTLAIQVGKPGVDNSIYISRNDHFYRSSAGTIISSLRTGSGLSVNNGSSVRAALDINGYGNTSGTWTAQFHNSDANNDALMIRNDGRIGFGTQSMIGKYNFNGTVRIAIQGSTGTSIGAYDNDGILTSVTLGSGLSLTGGTLSATGGSGTTDLAFSGTSSPVTLTSSTGTDVTFTAGTGITLAATGTNITITGTAAGVTGSGTTNALPKFTSSTVVGDSQVSDNGTTVGVGTTTGTGKLAVWGSGTTSATWTAQFHNAAGNNNALRIRDDGRVVVGSGSTADATFNLFGSLQQRRASGSFGEFMLNEAAATGIGGFWDFYVNAATSPDGLGKFGYKLEGGSNNAAVQFQIYTGGNLSTPRAIFSNTGVGIGTIAPEARLHSKGSSSDSGSFIALFQNSSAQNALAIRNDLRIQFEGLSGTGNRFMELGSSGIATRSTIDPTAIILQGGNTFTAAATIGTNDLQDVVIESNNTGRFRVEGDGQIVLGLNSSAAVTDAQTTIYTYVNNAPAIAMRVQEASGAGTYIAMQSGAGTARGNLGLFDGNVRLSSETFTDIRGASGVLIQAGSRDWLVNTAGTLQFPSLSTNPSSPAEGTTWYNSTNDHLHLRENGRDNQLAHVEGDMIGDAVAVYTSNTTLTGRQYASVADANAGSFTITLGSALSEGRWYTIECRRNGTNTITFDVESTYNLAADGVSSFPNDAPLACGVAGVGIQAAHKVYTVRRIGTQIIFK